MVGTVQFYADGQPRSVRSSRPSPCRKIHRDDPVGMVAQRRSPSSARRSPLRAMYLATLISQPRCPARGVRRRSAVHPIAVGKAPCHGSTGVSPAEPDTPQETSRPRPAADAPKRLLISSVDRLIDWSAATGCSPMLGARWRSSRLQHQLLRLEHPSRPERPDKRPPGQSRKGPTLDKSIARFAATRQPDEVSDRDEHVWRAEIVRFCLPITPEPASPVSN